MSTSTPSRKDRDSRGGGIITYHKSCVNLTRRLDLEHEHVESMWYELKGKLRKKKNYMFFLMYKYGCLYVY